MTNLEMIYLFLTNNIDVSITLGDNVKYYPSIINVLTDGIDIWLPLVNCLELILSIPLTLSDVILYELVTNSMSYDFSCNGSIESIEPIDPIYPIDLPRTGHMSNYLSYSDYLLLLLYNHFKNHLAYYLILISILIQQLISIVGNNISFNRFSIYLYLLILQAKPVLAMNFHLVNKLVTSIGWLIYIILMSSYDLIFKNIQHQHIINPMFVNGRISYRFIYNRIILGLVFLLTINNGILFSNSLYNLIAPLLTIRNTIIVIIFSYIVAALCSLGWIYSARPNILGYNWRTIRLSILRAIFESLAFASLSLSNYVIWSILPQNTYTYTITFIGGLLVYLLFSFFQVYIETNLNNLFIYGALYCVIFTSLSFSSSGLFFLMGVLNMGMPSQLALMILCFINIILFPLEVYRFIRPNITLGNNSSNTGFIGHFIGERFASHPIVIYIISIIYQLIVFFSFAFSTFIWLSMFGLTI